MKVESVQAYPIRLKAGETLQGGTFSFAYFQTVLVRAVADGGVGWGEAMTRFDPGATALLVKFLAKSIVGRGFVTVGEAWNRIWRELRIRGHTRGTDVEALSGIEMALYDSYGRMVKKPLNELFSKTPSRTVPAYAGSLFASRGRLEDQVETAKGMGVMGAKVKVASGGRKTGRPWLG